MNLGIPELIIIFLLVLVIFGAGKIPKIAKDIGSGIREFKKSLSGEEDTPRKIDDTNKQ
jgi:sec-independent protein translocase protein TatA